MAMPITIDPVIKGKRRPRRVSKTKRSMGPAGASTVSKDGKRMKTTKTPTAKQKQLQKLKDMRSKVMGTQKVMVAAMGGQAKASKKRAMSEAERRRFMDRLKKGPGKPKVGMPKRKGLAGLMAGAAKGAGKAAGKGLKGALAKLAGKTRRPSGAKLGAAAKAFQKAKARKPSGRLTADDLRRATRSR
jgi:hypothetical protein